MKKILLVGAILVMSVSCFAQKNTFKKNTFSENIGVVIPLGDVELDNNPAASFGLSYQRSFTQNIGLLTSLNAGFFKIDENLFNAALQDYMDYTGKSSAFGEASGSRFYNAGIGLSEGLEFGNSGFFFEGYEQLVLGMFQDSEIIIDKVFFPRTNNFTFGGKFGIQCYKMFGGFGIGLNADYSIGKVLDYVGSLQYIDIQLKLVQKF